MTTIREALAELVRLQDTPDEHANWGHVDAAWNAARATLAAQPAQAQKAVAWVTECDEIGDDGKPTRLRDLDWYESEIENLPVGTKLYAGRAQP